MDSAARVADGDMVADPLGAVLAGDLLRAVYQPIVCLDRLVPVGVEALVRGPAGTPLESPGQLFAAAGEQGRTGILDWASRRAALTGALQGGLRGPASLFLNAEPEGLRTSAFPGFEALADAVADTGVHVVLEITERALTRDPAELLRTVQRVRERGWLLAVDDVGAERASLALLPFLAPDVIKLDLRLIQARTTREVAETVNAVLAHSEATGAAVLAEGIETERHLELARSMGARLGQGWYFGRPGALNPQDRYVPLLLSTQPPQPTPGTPWELVAGLPRVRTAGKALLVAMSKTLERQAELSGGACVLLGAFQHEQFFTADTAQRYQRLAATAALASVLGVDMSSQPTPGVQGSALTPDDPLVQEWDVAVVGPHFAGALIARERPTDGGERSFDYLVTYDRGRVLAVARSLMTRIQPPPSPVRQLPTQAPPLGWTP